MKLIKNWRNKWRIKFKAKVRMEYRKEFSERFDKKYKQVEREKELHEQTKNKEIESLHEHYKKEIEIVRQQEANKWKTLLDERDKVIEVMRTDKEKRRDAINKFEQMIQDFETKYTGTRIEIQAAGEYVKKATQKLLYGSNEWEDFTNTYRKDFPKIQEKLKEE